jgi:hypothetical protein
LIVSSHTSKGDTTAIIELFKKEVRCQNSLTSLEHQSINVG